MAVRTLLYGAAGETLLTSENVSEQTKAVLLETFGYITGIGLKDWVGRGGNQAFAKVLLMEIVKLVGKAAVEQRFPGLSVVMPGEEAPNGRPA